MKQLILDLAWDPLPPFAGFLPGDNAAVVAQLREQAWPGAPVYLWGPAGAGKTQLLHELQARAIESGLVAQWFDAASTTPWELADDASNHCATRPASRARACSSCSSCVLPQPAGPHR